jgi:hypothetical protein
LTGAASAALVMLVCAVLERHAPGATTRIGQAPQNFWDELSTLLDDDAPVRDA